MPTAQLFANDAIKLSDSSSVIQIHVVCLKLTQSDHDFSHDNSRVTLSLILTKKQKQR